MATNSGKLLDIRHIAAPTIDIVKYIDHRRKGHSFSLKTKWPKLNRLAMGGLEPNVLISIVGMSGSGKSSFLNQIENDIFECNPDAEIVVLSFSFEMLSERSVGRRISNKLNMTVSELYSSDYANRLTDEQYELVKEEALKIKEQSIFYIDDHGDVPTIENTILTFAESDAAKGKWIVITLDHTLLVSEKQNEAERIVISDLQKMFIRLKKNRSFKKTIIQLSQINRDIESAERKNNPAMQFPQRSDIFGAEAIYQSSDYVWFIHSPQRLGLVTYGPRNWPVEGYIYLHILKNRDGESKVIVFNDELKYNKLVETSITTDEVKQVGKQ
jgi:replicative DNA helicase